jgi:Chaperone of endosialidase
MGYRQEIAGRPRRRGTGDADRTLLAFTLFTNNTDGIAIAGPVSTNGVAVANGLFRVLIDFGFGAFTGQSTWMEVEVATNGASSFTTVSPRQQLTPAPYAIFAETSGSLNLPSTAVSPAIIYSGSNLLFYADQDANVFSGQYAGNLAISGAYNTGNGYAALYSITSGDYNTASGYKALRSNTNGNFNTANGALALFSNTSGAENTAIGSGALENNTGGGANTANGFDALDNNTIGSFNTANGGFALFTNLDDSYNTADGFDALYSLMSGDFNTADGFGALENLTEGDNNIALGYEAGRNLTSGNDNIDIGNEGESVDTGIIRIGTPGTHTNTFISGIYESTASGGAPVYVDFNGQLGTLTSSWRYKDDIRNMGDASDVLLSLRPVSFRYKPEIDPKGIPQFGLVAEEVDQVDPDLVVRDEHHGVYTVRYETVNAMLLNEFQKEHRKVEQQNSEIQALKTRSEKVDSLERRVADLEQVVRLLVDRR